MVSTRPPISKYSSPFHNFWATERKAPITIGIIVTFMFHSFFNSLARSRCLYFFSLSFSFILRSTESAKSTNFQVIFFWGRWIIIRSGLLTDIGCFVCMSKTHRSFWVSFSRTDDGLCVYYLFVWSNLSYLHISQWISLPIIIIIMLLLENFSLEFEWQQVYSSPQEFYQYSGRSQ